MDLDQLRTFLAVLDQASFSRAAQVLRIGQSTVSFHVKALETALGTRLIDRRGGRLRPTASGAVLRRYALKIVALRDEAIERVRTEDSGEVGQLALSASTIPAEYLLPAALATFVHAHPRVTVSMEVSDTRKALAALVTQACELAFVGAQSRDPRVLFTPFAEDEVLLVGRAQNPLTANRLRPQDLARVRLIVREEGSGTRQSVTALLERAAAADGHLPPLQVGSSEAAKQCALEGAGLAFLSRRAVAEELRAGRLTSVAAPGLPVRRRFYVARMRSSTVAAPARLFLRQVLSARA